MILPLHTGTPSPRGRQERRGPPPPSTPPPAVVDVIAVGWVSLFMLFLFPLLSGFPSGIPDWARTTSPGGAGLVPLDCAPTLKGPPFGCSR